MSEADELLRSRIRDARIILDGGITALADESATLGAADRSEQLAKRRRLVATFRLLIESVYTHLPQKRSMYGFDPVQRLRLLGERIQDEDLTDVIFHREMAQILTDLRDAHTRYLGPRVYGEYALFLPILVERYTEGGSVGYIASKAVPLDAAQSRAWNDVKFEEGVEITHWNGVPIDRAVELYAARETGGRSDARIARALESLTIRPLGYALPPDEEWVDIAFRTIRGARREVRLEWTPVSLSEAPDPPDATAALAQAYNPIAEGARNVKKMLFATEVWHADERELGRPTVAESAAEWNEDKTEWLTGAYGGSVAARWHYSNGRPYGHLRIFSFRVDDDQAFINEIESLLAHMPTRGLIIDLRANPGGLVWAAEGLLQLFTPNLIHPTRFSFAATDLTRAMAGAKQNGHLRQWAESLNAAVATGVTHSRSIPLTPPQRCNNRGQIYPGPAVAIVDANTYSAGDLFAAGFTDNHVGKLVCTDVATGGGGANIWTPAQVNAALATTGFDLSDIGDVSYTVAIRRANRIGDITSEIEDVGVSASFRRPLTKRDLTEKNRDLLDYACRLLDTEVRTDMEYEIAEPDIRVRVAGLSRVELDVDESPRTTAEPDATGRARLPLPAHWRQHDLQILGYDGETLRQRRHVKVGSG